MQTNFFFLSPVEVVKVTKDNLEEAAAWCGGRVAETESRKVKGRMDKYVWVPTPKGTIISWAFPGMFITRRIVNTVEGDTKETWAVFRREYFERNYFDTPEIAIRETWEKPKKSLSKLVVNKEDVEAMIAQAVEEALSNVASSEGEKA